MTFLSSVLSAIPDSALAPWARARDNAQRARLERVLSSHRDDCSRAHEALAQWDALAARGATHTPEAGDVLSRIDRAARSVLSALHEGDDGPWGSASRVIDRAVRSERREWMDRDMPVFLKEMEIHALDRLNHQLGSYDQWGRVVASVLRGVANPRLHDLASGSGGFFRALARRGRETGDYAGWDLVCSDVAEYYVETGRTLAVRDGVADRVRFEHCDALSLGSLRDQVDLFVCTQATHHMPPGVVVCMLHQAAKSATRGVLVIDLMRSASLCVGSAFLLTASMPWFPLLLLDGMQSMRRSRTPAELEALARLAGATGVNARFVAPGFVRCHAWGVAS